MFYAVLAPLVNEPYASSKHIGIITYFNRHFIKGGLLPVALGRALNRAFELRQRSDYREYVEPSLDQVEPLIEESKAFIVAVKDYLAKCHVGL